MNDVRYLEGIIIQYQFIYQFNDFYKQIIFRYNFEWITEYYDKLNKCMIFLMYETLAILFTEIKILDMIQTSDSILKSNFQYHYLLHFA